MGLYKLFLDSAGTRIRDCTNCPYFPVLVHEALESVSYSAVKKTAVSSIQHRHEKTKSEVWCFGLVLCSQRYQSHCEVTDFFVRI